MIEQLIEGYDSFAARYLSLRDEWGTLVDVAVVLGTTLLLDLLSRLILKLLHRKVLASRNLWDDALYRSVNGPLQLLLWIGGTSLAIQIGLSASYQWLNYMPLVRNVLVILAVLWFVMRLIASIEKNALARASAGSRRLDTTSTDAMAKLARLFVLIVTLLALLQVFGMAPSSLLAFSGIGGIAVGFAARDVLANIFGGVTVYLNRPFSVGDWIRSPDRDIEGVVEAIGWRATTVRRFDKRPLYVPNAVFSNVALENPSRMSNRLINETVAIRFDDAALVPDIVEAIRHMLDEDEAIDSDQVILTYLDSLGASSINLLVYCYTRTIDWAEYLAIKQSVLQRVQDTIRSHGAAVSLPTQIIHVPDTLSVASAGRDDLADDEQEEIDTQKVQSARQEDVARERQKPDDVRGPDNPGEQGSS